MGLSRTEPGTDDLAIPFLDPRHRGDGRDVMIAGTRGSRSYLVVGHAGAQADYSVAHGAGRKMSRAGTAPALPP